ncbi:hypothetical protein Asphe3_41290 (plasmid) [Pseudarthrobacter phenanthrenivorans Sphe3]|uniref:Lipoprotein n=1 Tax=Pseudarthrobacter phenanthrenivorans (strain DSM 18606 / JCM 16027 / LMG 23796 / Sphe3) TaxID=930171 RepID=F0MCE3_PSEPM|nr:hypothetical protein [Pseudarthrobacter phenanthrenivorans]ADX75194.1 hypothetical protein Asphe3_41290 [Pseudarthrobacter phenanthrenivorans Sphe3]
MKRALTALTALLVCTACAPVSTSTPAEPLPTTSTTSTATLSAGGKPQAPGGTAPATLGIAWDEASKTAALETAAKAMTLYARPTVTDKEWIQELGQLLTAQATADYQYVDPANIPVTRITGPGQLNIDEKNGFGCHVVFPTDAGDYNVQLLRTGAGKPWQVNRITPPNGTK